MKKRLDITLLERGLVQTREKAQGLILAGQVLLEDTPVTKSGHLVSEHSAIRIRGEQSIYVSRGGIKLERALDLFNIQLQDKVALDIGASTGGFTQVLLLRGARQVFAVDVGHSQLDWLLRKDKRVVVLEKVNARYLEFSQIGQKIDIITIDVSFISLEKIMPALMKFAHDRTDWVTLIKPQFEVGKSKVGKGGIVRSENDQNDAVLKIQEFCKTLGLGRQNLIESPITGTKGNKEFLAHWKKTN